jgi:hypothetical protein
VNSYTPICSIARERALQSFRQLDGRGLEGRDRDTADAGCVRVRAGIVEEVDHNSSCAGGVTHSVVAGAGDVDNMGIGEALGCDSGLPGGGDEIERSTEEQHRHVALGTLLLGTS